MVKNVSKVECCQELCYYNNSCLFFTFKEKEATCELNYPLKNPERYFVSGTRFGMILNQIRPRVPLFFSISDFFSLKGHSNYT